MANQSIRVKFGVTANLGDMQFARVETELERTVIPQEDLELAYREAWKEVVRQTERMVRVARKRVR